jgi:hypothetical protein
VYAEICWLCFESRRPSRWVVSKDRGGGAGHARAPAHADIAAVAAAEASSARRNRGNSPGIEQAILAHIPRAQEARLARSSHRCGVVGGGASGRARRQRGSEAQAAARERVDRRRGEKVIQRVNLFYLSNLANTEASIGHFAENTLNYRIFNLQSKETIRTFEQFFRERATHIFH